LLIEYLYIFVSQEAAAPIPFGVDTVALVCIVSHVLFMNVYKNIIVLIAVVDVLL
jgi:hypothetical protein